jgi:hypothetical protein
MKLFSGFSVFILLFPVWATAQQNWDDLEVSDGPNPTLRYGFYTGTSGQALMGRYYFVDDGTSLRVRLAPYGKPAVELPVHSYDRAEGLLKLRWAGKPARTCQLQRFTELLFEGNCIENSAVMPIAIRVANESDFEWMGAHLLVSETDIAILERAKQILTEQQERNQSGDRNCEDDIAASQLSVFCALYSASLEITGVYRHRRPAMQALREVLQEKYPGKYAHRLRDINNRSDILDEELIEAVNLSQARLMFELQIMD